MFTWFVLLPLMGQRLCLLLRMRQRLCLPGIFASINRSNVMIVTINGSKTMWHKFEKTGNMNIYHSHCKGHSFCQYYCWRRALLSTIKNTHSYNLQLKG